MASLLLVLCCYLSRSTDPVLATDSTGQARFAHKLLHVELISLQCVTTDIIAYKQAKNQVTRQ